MERVKDVIRAELGRKQFLEVDAYGVFINEEDNRKKLIAPGAVYGFFVQLKPTELQALIAEAQQKGTATAQSASIRSLCDNVYPLYWGKDKSLGARINAHIKNPDGENEGKKGTGLIRLCAYRSLRGKSVAVFSMCVDRCSEFEKHLKIVFPDLLKTKKSKI